VPDKIRHVFVLMLENRAFDHMLGCSGIAGIDAVSGTRTQINELDPTVPPTNSFNGQSFKAAQPADNAMTADLGHEFLDALVQLCGPGAVYPTGGTNP